MVIPPYSDTMLQMFCYGKPWSGRCDAPGVVQVIKTIDGDLAVLFFGAGKDVPSEMPPWSVTAVGNVVTLPWATSSAVKKVRRGRKVESAAGESTHALGCIRLVWSAPV